MRYDAVIDALRTQSALIPTKLAHDIGDERGMRYNALGILLMVAGVSDAELLEMAEASVEDIYGRWAWTFLDHYAMTETEAMEIDFATRMTAEQFNSPLGRLVEVIGYVRALSDVDVAFAEAQMSLATPAVALA